MYGLGLIEAIPDRILEDNVARSASRALGIHGALNRSGNDGTVTRFGWKASEANAVVARFAFLSASDKQAILNFLRSL